MADLRRDGHTIIGGHRRMTTVRMFPQILQGEDSRWQCREGSIEVSRVLNVNIGVDAGIKLTAGPNDPGLSHRLGLPSGFFFSVATPQIGYGSVVRLLVAAEWELSINNRQ